MRTSKKAILTQNVMKTRSVSRIVKLLKEASDSKDIRWELFVPYHYDELCPPEDHEDHIFVKLSPDPFVEISFLKTNKTEGRAAPEFVFSVNFYLPRKPRVFRARASNSRAWNISKGMWDKHFSKAVDEAARRFWR